MTERVFKLPSWAKDLPDDACLSTMDIAKAAGLSDVGVKRWVKAGKLPKPDYLCPRAHGRTRKNMWSLRLLRQWGF